MVSTLTILFVSVLSLVLVWAILRPGMPQVRSLEDWEANKHEVDLNVFRILLDSLEERYLRGLLPRHESRLFQKRRLVLALRSLELVGKNAAMLMKLGRLARGELLGPASARPRTGRRRSSSTGGSIR